MRGFKLALAQLSVTSSVTENLAAAANAIRKAAQAGANIVALPECFNSPYGTNYFKDYAEEIPGPSTSALSEAAKENGVYVIGGSIPEKSGQQLFNTSTVYNPEGTLVATHRKVHLFDIDVPGKIRFQESEVLTGGDSLTVVETEWCKIGVGICYDIRFPELAMLCAAQGCELLCYPGAFNMTTGPAHWELLQRARALDNQLYVAAISPARDESASYQAWGHSTVVDPWGTVVATTEHGPDIIYADIGTC
eukprot:m.330866 g.330866  ORF g.330866 m.330866 type:complete len:250 (-) comp19768_c4_seq5:213-962(-)